MVKYKSKLKKKLKKLDIWSYWHKAHVMPLPLLFSPATYMSANCSFIPETLWSIKRLYVKELLLVIQQAVWLENITF